IYVTLTANCNLRCIGCRYGRDFMPGAQLSWPLVRGLLDDCKEVGIRSIRLYGGEPLLHKDLTRIVEHSVGLGLNTWMTTNGILLRDRIDDLYKAGLRSISVGYYGTGEEYDSVHTSGGGRRLPSRSVRHECGSRSGLGSHAPNL